MNKKIKGALVGAAAALVIGVGGYIAISHSSPAGGAEIYVQSVKSLNNDGMVYVQRFSGVVEAQDSVNIKKDGSREVEEIYVEEGQKVGAGEKLFRYDVRDAQRQIETLRLELEELDNQIEGYNLSIADLQKQRAQTSDEGMKYQYTSEINGYEMSVRQAQFDKKSKEADITRYNQEMTNAVVTASINGTIKAINENGGWDNYGNEKPFMTITQTGEFRVKGKLDEMSMGTITPGTSVLIRSRVDENEVWSGTVTEIGNEPDQNNQDMMYYGGSGENASKYPFYVSMNTSTGLMLGQHVFIEPDYGQTAGADLEGVWLDSSFIAYDENGNPYVWKSVKKKLKKVSVELGEMDEMTWKTQILSGVSEDDYLAWPDDTYTEGQKTVSDEDMR